MIYYGLKTTATSPRVPLVSQCSDSMQTSAEGKQREELAESNDPLANVKSTPIGLHGALLLSSYHS